MRTSSYVADVVGAENKTGGKKKALALIAFIFVREMNSQQDKYINIKSVLVINAEKKQKSENVNRKC